MHGDFMAAVRALPRAEAARRACSASDAPGADIESFEEYVARRRGRGSRSDRTDEASTSASAPPGACQLLPFKPVFAGSGSALQAAPCQHPAWGRPRAAPAQAPPDMPAPWQPGRTFSKTAQRTRRSVREGWRTLTLARRAGSDARAIGASRGRGQARAVLNWRRARMAVTRKITTDMLGVQRRFQTLFEMFEDLSSGRRDPRAPGGRLPVLLLLGGGMAAGKSTVREIIGYDDFWSKARCAQDLLAPPAKPKALRRRHALMSACRLRLVRRAERSRPQNRVHNPNPQQCPPAARRWARTRWWWRRTPSRTATRCTAC